MVEPVFESTGGADARVASIGKYRLIASLGRGGMADVFLAVAQGPMGFNKLVVVKRLRANADDEVMLSMFFDEARLAARLAHPNVVQTFEVGEDGGSYFIAMEFLEGQPLNRLARAAKNDPFFTGVVWAKLASQALAGLHHAHEAVDFDGSPLHIVHRDVSPQNIFVTYAGQVRIVDFGIAKAALNSTHTQAGVIKGKLGYMAPEHARFAAVDRRADVFAMGIVLWEVLAREKLFKGDQLQVLQTLLNERVPRVSELRADVPPVLDAIVAKALEKNPEDRYATALEMQTELERFVRASGCDVDDAALAEGIVAHFASVRDEMKRQIQAYLSSSASTPSGALPELVATSWSGSHPSLGDVRTMTRPTGGAVVAVPESASLAGASTALPAADAGRGASRRSVAMVAVAAAAAVFLGAAILWRGSHRAVEETPSVTALPAEKARTVRLELASVPTGARVTWNDALMGVTPLSFDVSPGMQVVTLSYDGYEPETIALSGEASTPDTARYRVVTLSKTPTKERSLVRSLHSTPRGTVGGSVRGPSAEAPQARGTAPGGPSPLPPHVVVAGTAAATSVVRVIEDDPAKGPKVRVIGD